MSADKSDKRKRALWRIAVPWFATVLLVFAGFFGGLYSQEIRGAFPFVRGPYEGIEGAAVGFWVTFLLGMALLLIQQYQREQTRAESQTELEGAVLALQESIRTTPPVGFMIEWGEFFRVAQVAFQMTGSTTATTPAGPEAAFLQRSCRTILGAVAALAAKYDDREGSRYAANVMLFHPSGTSSPFGQFPLAKFRCPGEATGVLELRRELSASTDGEPDEEDTDIQEFCLELPDRAKVKVGDEDVDLWRVLPGAPMAAVTGLPDYLEDVGTIGTWCRGHGDFLRETQDEIVRYFRDETPTIASFVSIPLYLSFGSTVDTSVEREAIEEEDADGGPNEQEQVERAPAPRGGEHSTDKASVETPMTAREEGPETPAAVYHKSEETEGVLLAVLNIHCDEAGIIRGGGEETLAQFVPLVYPFGDLLVKLLRRLGVSGGQVDL
ncbi:MAG: hypothetical protein RJQ04_03105 [Longimicrobiales bacterium]